MSRPSNLYEVLRSPEADRYWTLVGSFSARSFREAIQKARQRDKSVDAYWRAMLMANRSGRKLGKTRTFAESECRAVLKGVI